MKIKSIINVITNSSSEVFIFKSNLKKNKILSDLHELTKDCIGCSEMRGILEIKTSNEIDWIPKDSFRLEVDYGYDLEKIKKYISSIGYIYGENQDTIRRKYFNEEIEKLLYKIEKAKSIEEVNKFYQKAEELIKERDNEN